jgi:hypothetical protein
MGLNVVEFSAHEPLDGMVRAQSYHVTTCFSKVLIYS